MDKVITKIVAHGYNNHILLKLLSFKMIHELNVIDTTTHSIKDTVSAVKEKIVSGTALLF